MGALILIDTLTNATVGAAMILSEVSRDASGSTQGHSLILIPGRSDLTFRVAEALMSRGVRAVVIDDSLIDDFAVPAVIRALDLAGVVAVSSRPLSATTIAEINSFAEGAVVVGQGLDDEAILTSIMVTP